MNQEMNEAPERTLGSLVQEPEQCLGAKSDEYRPSRGESLREHSISIQFLSIGCNVSVGCKTIPFTSTDEALTEITEYFKNPYDAQKKWRNILNNN